MSRSEYPSIRVGVAHTVARRAAALELTKVALGLDRTDEAQDRWKGAAADAFKDKLNEHRTTLGKVVRARCEDTAALLDAWAGQLREFQQEAGALGAKVTAVDEKRRRAVADAHILSAAMSTVGHDVAALEELTEQLAGFHTAAELLHERYLEAARQHARKMTGLEELPAGNRGWYGQSVDAAAQLSLLSARAGMGANVQGALRFFDEHIEDASSLWSDPAHGAQEVLERLKSLTPDELSAFILSLSPDKLKELNDKIGQGPLWLSADGRDNVSKMAWSNLLLGSLSGAALTTVQQSMPNIQPNLTGGIGGLAYRQIDGPLFGPNGPDITNDLHQGNCGDCWYLSSVAAIAERDPGFLQQHIRENPNGTYTVTFYKAGHPVNVTVDSQLPSDPLGGQSYAQVSGGTKWVAIYEKAYAQFKGGYDVIGKGGLGNIGLHDLTGQKYSLSISSTPPPSIPKTPMHKRSAGVVLGHTSPSAFRFQSPAGGAESGRWLQFWSHSPPFRPPR